MRQGLDELPAPTAPTGVPSAREIYELIAEAAYYRAQKRGFTPGLEADDWLQAETEVRERLRAPGGRRPNPGA